MTTAPEDPQTPPAPPAPPPGHDATAPDVSPAQPPIFAPASYPQTPGYPAAPMPGYPAPMPAPGSIGCEICGSTPALHVTPRGHRGMILLMQFQHREGTFCRNCGTAITRAFSARTLWQGWWGIASVFITPVVLLINAVTLHRLAAMPAPQVPVAPQPTADPAAPFGFADPASQGIRVGFDPGRSLWKRPAITGLLIPVAALGLGIAALPSTPDEAEYAADARPDTSAEEVREIPDAAVGDCWKETSSGGISEVNCLQVHTMQVYFVGTASNFATYRAAGEKLESGSAQADRICGKAVDGVSWNVTIPDPDPMFGAIYPQEVTLNDDSADANDLRIVCYIDSASVKAESSSVIEGY